MVRIMTKVFGAVKTTRTAGTAAMLVVTVLLAGASAQQLSSDAGGYRVPPDAIVEILDAPPTPGVLVGPERDVIVLVESRPMPPVAWLARPMHRLAGYRIDPRNSGPWSAPAITALAIRPLDAPRTTNGGGSAGASGNGGGNATADDNGGFRIVAPAGTTLGWPVFSPDGSHLSYAVVRDTGIELWVADIAARQPRPLTSAALNATWGNPCEWLADSSGVLCRFRQSARGSPPTRPRAPGGPNIQANDGQQSPVRTYQDLLAGAHDEALFRYHFTSQIATVELATGSRTDIGAAGLYASVDGAPDGEHLLVERIAPPFSRLLPARAFARTVELWSREAGGQGAIANTTDPLVLAELPLADQVPIGGVPTGPRGHRWHATAPATVIWAEAQDGGDPHASAPHRDIVYSLDAPFDAEPRELTRTEHRFSTIAWTADGTALVTATDRPTRWTRTSIIYPGGGDSRRLFDRSAENVYDDPGRPVFRPGVGGVGRTILQDGDFVYLAGSGASPDGDRPFVDRLNLATLETARLFRAEPGTYETVVAVLTDDGETLLTRRESPADPPNYLVRDTGTGTVRALTGYTDPAPILRGVEKRLLTYERADGVGLSATLYLPPGYREGDRPPMLMWAYPREYVDPAAASQVRGSPFRFTTLRGASHLLLLAEGYAILDGPAMPIVGEGQTANDTYVEQLVASAQAAIDAVVDLGVADRDRIAIGGHSYGAFMTANLLAHSDLFRAGIARSGAYNRTLTPFGFQNERRTFWEARDIYAAMSPFFHAEKVNEPILLTHGEIDNNSGTFPIQSERYYHALKGHGATVRYVTLPYESHGYAARESVLHVVAEMLDWCNEHLAPRQAPAP